MQPSQRRPRLLASPARAQQLLAWQGCSVLLTATGFTSQRLAERGIAAPTAQSLAVYLVLMLHAITARRDNRVAGLPPVARPWWQWLLLGFADVEGNYLIVRAYQYTDITSVTLLDAFAVPGVMALSALTLGARYGRKQICGVALCVSGLATLVMSDALLRPMHSWHPQPWRGDVLCLVGASLYACSNVAEEAFLRSSSVSNYLPRLGAAGALLSAAQCALIEREALASAWRAFSSASLAGRTELLLLELLFVGSMASFYSLVSHLLQRGATAAEMNISLLTSDFWSVLAGVALLGSRLTWWYPPAFVATLSGLVLYYHRPAPSAARQLTEPLNARPWAAATVGAMEEGGAGLREGEGEAGHRADAAARAGGQPDGRVE